MLHTDSGIILKTILYAFVSLVNMEPDHATKFCYHLEQIVNSVAIRPLNICYLLPPRPVSSSFCVRLFRPVLCGFFIIIFELLF